jgi:putative oxidoreductase
MTTNDGTSSIARWSPLPLRLIVGYGFMAHGFAKLSRGTDVFAAVLNGLGVPAPHTMALLTIWIELLGGAAILLGAFVLIASIPMIVSLLVAIVTVHLPYGFSSIKLVAVTAAGPQFGKPGYETALLYIACLAALVAGGTGPLSIDDFIGARHDRYRRFTLRDRQAISLCAPSPDSRHRDPALRAGGVAARVRPGEMDPR